MTKLIAAMFLTGCAYGNPAQVDQNPPVEDAPHHDVRKPVKHEEFICQYDCVTGALEGWYNVPSNCDWGQGGPGWQNQWYLTCQDLTFTPYTGGVYSCEAPAGACDPALENK